MNWKFWKQKTPAPAAPPLLAMSDIETRILTDFTKNPAFWPLRNIEKNDDCHTRADSMGVTIYSKRTSDGVQAHCGLVSFGRLFADRWHAVAWQRIMEKEAKDAAAARAAVFAELESRWGAATDKRPRVAIPRD